MVNPGLEQAFSCSVLMHLMADWDAFLDRAELFGLSEKMTARIWNGRKHGKSAGYAECPGRIVHGSSMPDAVETCPHRFRDTCLLLMPTCTGRCERFAAFSGPCGKKEKRT
jgi:ferredoxin-thioredoxin reductase catalytic subunit